MLRDTGWKNSQMLRITDKDARNVSWKTEQAPPDDNYDFRLEKKIAGQLNYKLWIIRL